MRDRATQQSNTGVQPLDHHTAEPLTKGGVETNSSDVAEITEAELTEPLPWSLHVPGESATQKPGDAEGNS